MTEALSLSQPSAKTKRAWLRAHGHPVPARGRISLRLMKIYENSARPTPPRVSKALELQLVDRINERMNEFLVWECFDRPTNDAQLDLIYYIKDLCGFDPELAQELLHAMQKRGPVEGLVNPRLEQYMKDLIEAGGKRVIDDIQDLYFDWPTSDIARWLKRHGEPSPIQRPLTREQLEKFRNWSHHEAEKEFEKEKVEFANHKAEWLEDISLPT